MTVEVCLFIGNMADDSPGCMAWDSGFITAGDERIAETVEIHDATFIIDNAETIEQFTERTVKCTA